MIKNIFTSFAVLALVSLCALAFAAPRQGHRAGGMREMTPENRVAIERIVESHQERLYELREKLWAKHTELQALSVSGKGERSDIQGLISDISALRQSIHQERKAIRAEVEKQTGLKGYGPRDGENGRGMMGSHVMGMDGGMGMGGGMGGGMGMGMGY